MCLGTVFVTENSKVDFFSVAGALGSNVVLGSIITLIINFCTLHPVLKIENVSIIISVLGFNTHVVHACGLVTLSLASILIVYLVIVTSTALALLLTLVFLIIHLPLSERINELVHGDEVFSSRTSSHAVVGFAHLVLNKAGGNNTIVIPVLEVVRVNNVTAVEHKGIVNDPAVIIIASIFGTTRVGYHTLGRRGVGLQGRSCGEKSG
mmetsp:Transcript_28233/g.43251  ORF Transcript_28233/g.43251 Transcript_28233/m.43251 type:complete len:208 (+) Transcript_28233:599-1222(+)